MQYWKYARSKRMYTQVWWKNNYRETNFVVVADWTLIVKLRVCEFIENCFDYDFSSEICFFFLIIKAYLPMAATQQVDEDDHFLLDMDSIVHREKNSAQISTRRLFENTRKKCSLGNYTLMLHFMIINVLNWKCLWKNWDIKFDITLWLKINELSLRTLYKLINVSNFYSF